VVPLSCIWVESGATRIAVSLKETRIVLPDSWVIVWGDPVAKNQETEDPYELADLSQPFDSDEEEYSASIPADPPSDEPDSAEPPDDSFEFLDVVDSFEGLEKSDESNFLSDGGPPPPMFDAPAEEPEASSDQEEPFVEPDDSEESPIKQAEKITKVDALSLVLAHCQECGTYLHGDELRLRHSEDLVVFYCTECRSDGEIPSLEYIDRLQEAAENRTFTAPDAWIQNNIREALACGRSYIDLMLGLVGEGEIGENWNAMIQKTLEYIEQERAALSAEPLSQYYHPELYRIRRLAFEGIHKKRFLKKPKTYHSRKVRLLGIAFQHLRVVLEEMAHDHPDVITFLKETDPQLALVKQRDKDKRETSW